MFGNQKPQPPKPVKRPAPIRDSAVTILTSGCHFNGKLYCRGSSRIGGRIEGQIISEGLLIIEEQALITAEIKADEAVIQGRVKGKLEASGRVELTASSWFEGDISTPVLVVSEGAQFNGRSYMQSKSKVPSQPSAKPGKPPERKTPGQGNKDPEITPNSSDVKDRAPDVAVL